MKLYCMRHGEAQTADLDPRCPLTERGRRGVTSVAHFLSQSGVKIPQVYHSGKLRAQQTAAIVADVLQITRITESPSLLNCEADVEDLLIWLSACQEDTLLIGHLPFIPCLINSLVLGPQYAERSPIVQCSPGVMVCLEQQGHQWIIRWVRSPII